MPMPAEMDREDALQYSEHRINVRRTARWGLIGELDEGTTEVWFALHGYGQLAGAFARAAVWPLAPGRAFVFPEALQRFYSAGTLSVDAHREAEVAASWMTREARDDDISDNLSYLDALMEEVVRRSPLAALAILGFSQGDATAARWAYARSLAGVPPKALVLWAGILPPELDLGPSSPLRGVSVTMVVGHRDQIASQERVQSEMERLAHAGFAVAVVAFDGGHRLDDPTLQALACGAIDRPGSA